MSRIPHNLFEIENTLLLFRSKRPRREAAELDADELDAAKSLLSLYGDSGANDSAAKTEQIETFVQTDDDEREQTFLKIIVQLTEKVAHQTLTLSEQSLMMDKVLDEHESERVKLETKNQQLLQAVVGLTEKVAVQQTTLDESKSVLVQQARSIDIKTCLETSLRNSLSAREKTIQDLRESEQKFICEKERLQIALQQMLVREQSSQETVNKFEKCLAVMKEAMSAL